MEAVGTISEGDQWNSSFNGICSDEADFMSQLLGACSVPNEVPTINGHDFSISNWAAYESNPSIGGVGESSMYSSDDQTSVYSWSSMYPSSSANQECCYPSINNNNNVAHHIFVGNNNLMTMDYCLMMDGKINSHVIDGGDDDFLNQDNLSNGSNVEYDDEKVVSEKIVPRGKETLISEPLMKESNNNNPSEISRKRPRIPPGEFQRSKRNMKINKCRKVDDSDEDNNNNNNSNNNNTDTVLHRQSSSGCCSEDDSNGSHEPSRAGPGSSSKGSGKTRACRGSATDPQSLYARKRRERINERLKILQNLVPNGTKVDISTMLEEAVQYVKFLQLQIKLLSSEDMWMYAPIAYNGMNIGLDNLKIPNVES